ncbi:MAG: V-type ATP synthase subunit E family protein [Candidatus Aminicenantales bacterium]
MSLEKIIDTILSDARAEAENIIRESQKRAEEIKKRAQEEALEQAALYRQEAEREARLEASRILTQARLEKKLSLLRQRKELIEEVLKRALAENILEQGMLFKKVILKKGERQEAVDRERFFEEFRTRLENDIVEALKL